MTTTLQPHRFALFAGLALATLSAAPGHTSSLSVGQNYQESSNKTSTSPPNATGCSLTYCYIVFNKVPTGKQLIVTQVSCSLNVSDATADATQMFMEPQRPNGNWNERFQILIPSTMPSNLPGYNLVLNSAAYMLFTSNDRPEIYVGLKSAAQVVGFCSIAGQMVDKAP